MKPYGVEAVCMAWCGYPLQPWLQSNCRPNADVDALVCLMLEPAMHTGASGQWAAKGVKLS